MSLTGDHIQRSPLAGDAPDRMMRDARVQAVMTIVIALVSIAAAPILNTVSPILAGAVLSLVGIAVARGMPGQAPFFAIFWLLFQNIFISLSSPLIPAPEDLEIIKGYNFLLCAVMWLTMTASYVLELHKSATDIRRLMTISWIAIASIVVYFVIGFPSAGTAAVIYLRNIIFPVILFQLALLAASSHEIRLRPLLIYIAVAFIACGYVELCFRDFWLDVTNGHAYWRFEEIKATNAGTWEREMRRTGQVMVTLKDRFVTSFLNTPLLKDLGFPDILRTFGPNTHPISFAYALVFFILVFASIGSPALALATLPIAVLTGVKGALILGLFVAGCWVSTRLIGAVRTLILGIVALVLYVAYGIYLGLQIGDYHVIGFMGGWNGLLSAPFGRGLGIGGNLTQDFSDIDWSAAQQSGAVDGAFESSVGVLIYQMGIAAVIPLGFTAYVGFRTWLLHAQTGNLLQGVAGFGMLVILANGVFQEEALFSPLALGLLLTLAGLILGSEARRDAA